MKHNPYELKHHDVDWNENEKPPTGYLDTDAFLKFTGTQRHGPNISPR